MVATHPIEPNRSRRRDALAADPVAQYLDQIGRYDLLTPVQERKLAEEIAAGVAARRELGAAVAAASSGDGAEQHVLGRTEAEMAQLRRAIRRGDRAFDEFVNANLRLVVSVAKRYQATGVPLLDLIQDGNLGLIRAVEKFDHTKGFRFSTYGVWWIRQFISRGIAVSRSSVRLPTRANDDLQRLRSAVNQVNDEGGSASTERIGELASMSTERVVELAAFLSDPVSLSTGVGDGTVELGDFVEDQRAAAEVESPGQRLSKAEIDELLAPLDDRERTIIDLRYGFDGSDGTSVTEISAVMGLSRERVRQLERRAISKLSHPSRPSLRSYILGC